MIHEEIMENIKGFIEKNAKDNNIELGESNVCKLTDIIVKEKDKYTFKINKFNEKFKEKSEKFGVYFIINAGDDNIVVDEIENIYKDENNYSKFQFMIGNEYGIDKLERKLKTLNDLDEYLKKILYIGKAGGEKNSDLYNRLGLYMKYGVGNAQNHKGGRAIWQIDEKKRKDLYIFWIYVNGDKAYEKAGKLETLLLQEYNKRVSENSDERKSYKYPFANWRC